MINEPRKGRYYKTGEGGMGGKHKRVKESRKQIVIKHIKQYRCTLCEQNEKETVDAQ